jgi:signal peptide peptidase SppA
MTMRKNGMSLLQSFADGPSLIDPQYFASLRTLAQYEYADQPSGLRGLFGGFMGGPARSDREASQIDNARMCAAMGMTITDSSKPFAFSDGIAVIPVYGALLHRDNWCDSYATGYDFIRNKLAAAMGDPEVSGIVFDMNSYGGHVAGNFELCDEIYAAREVKPILTVVDALCYSGGYSIGSSGSRMVATPSGGIGSIGVVMMHMSVEKMLKDFGVEISFIHAGKHKVDGNPYENLPKDVRARWQASVEKSYDKFVSLVARNRGIDTGAVRATEALCYDADDALALGLIDAIQTPAEALAAFRKELYGSDTNPQQGATKMTTTATAAKGGAGAENPAPIATNTPAAPAVAAAPAAPAAPAAEVPAAPAAAAAVPAPNAAADERARIKAITTCEEATGREALAAHFAYDTEMSVDAARAALAAAPVAAKAGAAAGTPFEAAMAAGNPDVGAGNDGGDGNDANASVSDRLAKNYQAATGVKLREA